MDEWILEIRNLVELYLGKQLELDIEIQEKGGNRCNHNHNEHVSCYNTTYIFRIPISLSHFNYGDMNISVINKEMFILNCGKWILCDKDRCGISTRTNITSARITHSFSFERTILE